MRRLRDPLVFLWNVFILGCFLAFVVQVYSAYEQSRPLDGFETFLCCMGMTVIFLKELSERLDRLNAWIARRGWGLRS